MSYKIAFQLLVLTHVLEGSRLLQFDNTASSVGAANRVSSVETANRVSPLETTNTVSTLEAANRVSSVETSVTASNLETAHRISTLETTTTAQQESKSTSSSELKHEGSLITSKLNISSLMRKDLGLMEQNLAGIMWGALHRKDCHAVLLTWNERLSRILHVIRYGFLLSQPVTVVDLSLLGDRDERHLPGEIWRNPKITCRTVFVDCFPDSSSSCFRFLESAKLWKWPDTQVVFMGNEIKATSFLGHRALRNTIQPLLFSLEENEPKNNISSSVELSSERIILAGYTRCLYCQNGYSKAVFLFRRPLEEIDPKRLNISVDPVENFQGTKFRATSVSYFPYIDNRLDSGEPGGTVTILDSLDKRLLEAISRHLNFTFVATSPSDMIPGYLSSNGTWNGMMRDIAELGADFSTSITVNPDRLKIVDKVRTIDTDWLCILSPQPQVLPRYLVITRTLTADVWIFLLVTITVWGVCLWGLQRAESRLSGRRGESLGESICYGWAAIVDHPPNPPSNLSGQVLVGWLLIGTLLISSCFKSSLVANLTVENKEKPIDSYEGLIKKVNWKWGVEKFFLTGAPVFYFSQNPDPVIQFIYNHTESMMGDLGLEKVRGGRYSFLSTFNRISYFLGVLYSDTFGRHPFYVSKSRYRISSDIGLGIRKGAPFLRRFSQLVHRLTEAGILSHWIKDVLQGRIREDRKLYRQKMKEGNVASTEGTSNAAFAQSLEDEREVVLKMEHFLGLYLVFLCGLGMAMITFLVELYYAFRHLGK